MSSFDPRLTPARPDLAAAYLRGRIAAPAYAEGQIMYVSTGIADVRREPSHDAPLDTQALFGEQAMLYEDEEGWGWIQLLRDGYVGYIAMAALNDGDYKPTHRVTVNRTLVYPCADMKMPSRRASPMGSAVRVVAYNGAFAKIGETAFVSAAHLSPIDSLEPDFVAIAERFLHSPYLWGGKTSLGIDCSGLVQVALSAAGFKAPRDSDLQEKELGTPLAPGDSLRRGDLVFWPGHVGIMQSKTELLHANAHHMLVVSEPLEDAKARIARPVSLVKRLSWGSRPPIVRRRNWWRRLFNHVAD